MAIKRTLSPSRIVVLALALAVVVPIFRFPAPAGAEVFGIPDIRVDDSLFDGTDQRSPAVALGPGGLVYVAYVEVTATDMGDIYIARSSDGGLTFPDRAKVDDDTTTAFQTNPSVAVGSGGAVYVAWEDYRQRTSDAEIYFSASYDGGFTWGDGLQNMNDAIVNDNPGIINDIETEPVVRAFGANAVFVMWTDTRRTHPDIYFDGSGDGGASWGPDVLVNDDVGNAPQANPSLAVNETGGLYAAWRDRRQSGDEIFFSRSGDGGATWSLNLQVNDDSGNHYQDRPSVAVTGSTVYLVWMDQRNGADDVFSSVSTDAGATWGDGVLNGNDPQVNDAVGLSFSPSIAVGGGLVHAAWRDGRNGDFDILSSTSVDGALWGDGLPNANDVRVNDDPTWSAADQGEVELAAAGALACAAWEDDREGNYDVRFSCFNGMGWGNGRLDNRDVVAAGWGTPVPGQQRSPQIASHGADLFAVWEDNRLGAVSPGIFFSSSADGGLTWGDGLLNSNDLRIDDAPAGFRNRPSLAVSLGGVIGVAWRDTRVVGSDIFFSSSVDGGVTWGNGEMDDTDTRVNSVGLGFQDWPSVGVLPNGTFVVAWEDYGGIDPDLFLAYSLDAGATWSARVRVDDDSAAAFQLRPAVDVDLGGVVHIVYSDDRSGDFDIRHTSCTLDGVGVICGDGVPDNDILVSDDTTGADQRNPRLTGALGLLVAAWQDSRTGDWDIRTSSFNGSAWGDGLPDNDVTINANLVGDQQGASLTGDNTALFAAWGDVSVLDVWNAVSFTAITWQNETQPNDPAAGAAAQSNVQLDLNSTRLFAIWDDDRGGDEDIYFASALRQPPAPPPPLSFIDLDPPGPLTFQEYGGATFTAIGYNQDGSKNDTWTPDWTLTEPPPALLGNLSGDPIAGFTANYTAGNLPGAYVVTVSNGSVNASALVTVVPLPLWSIVLTPDNVTLSLGAVQGFTAFGYDLYGQQNTSWNATISVAPTAGALLPTGGDAVAGFTYLYTAGPLPAADAFTIANGTVNATANLTLIAAPLAVITLSPWPGPIALQPTQSAAFLAFGYDAFGNLNTTWNATWSSVLGTYVPGGNATSGFTAVYTAGTVPGAGSIRVSDGLVSNQTSIAVSPGTLARIELTPWPGPFLIEVTQSLAFAALAYDAWGNQNITWTPVWTALTLLGSVGSFGGDPASGYTVVFTAGIGVGVSGVNVSASGVPALWNSTLVTILPGPLAVLTLSPWPGPTVLLPSASRTYTAIGYDAWGNRNTTMSMPTWTTTDGRGTLGTYGGTAAFGYTALYTAGVFPGNDNVSAATTLPGVSNSSAVLIVLPPGWDPLARIDLRPGPGPVPVAVGGAVSFVALGYDDSGAQNTTWVPTWSSGPLGSITFQGGNAVLGFSATYRAGPSSPPGVLDLIRVLNGTISATTTIDLVPGPFFRIVVLPPPVAPVHATDSLGLRAFGYDQYGNVNETWTAVWTLVGVHGALGTSAGNALVGFTNTYTAFTSTGVDTITVSYLGFSNFTQVEVLAGDLAKITIDPWPGPLLINPGTATSYRARGWDAWGNLNGTWVPTWGMTDARGSTVTPSGGNATAGFLAVYRAGAVEGLDNITVSSGAVSNQSSLFILPSGPMVSLALVPPTPVEMVIGESRMFTAKGYDAFGRLNTSWSPTWSLGGAPGILGLSDLLQTAPGVHQANLTALALGSASVVVTSDNGLTNVTLVNVVDKVPPVTAVQPLPPWSTAATIPLAVNATDSGGSGLDHVDIFVRRDAGAFVRLGSFAPGPVNYAFPTEGRYDFFSIGFDRAGNQEAAPFTPDATTRYDASAPTVIRVSPGSGTFLPGTLHIEVEFSEAVDPATLTLVLTDGDRTWTLANGTATWSGNTLVFEIGLDVPAGRVLQITVAGARDAAGNMMTDHAWELRSAALPRVGEASWWPLLVLVAVTTFILFFIARRRRDEDEERVPAPVGGGPERIQQEAASIPLDLPSPVEERWTPGVEGDAWMEDMIARAEHGPPSEPAEAEADADERGFRAYGGGAVKLQAPRRKRKVLNPEAEAEEDARSADEVEEPAEVPEEADAEAEEGGDEVSEDKGDDTADHEDEEPPQGARGL